MGRFTQISCLVVIAFSFAVTLISFPFLPDRMALHFDLAGAPNTYMPKELGAFLIPSIFFFVLLVIYWSVQNTPQDEIQSSRISPLTLATMAFGFSIQFCIIGINLSSNPLFFKTMIVLLGVFLFYVGFFTAKTRRNRLVGIKTKWTLSDDRVWTKTNRLGGLAFIISGMAIGMSIFFKPLVYFLVFLVVSLVGLIPCSYLLFRGVHPSLPDPHIRDGK